MRLPDLSPLNDNNPIRRFDSTLLLALDREYSPPVGHTLEHMRSTVGEPENGADRLRRDIRDDIRCATLQLAATGSGAC